MNLCGLLMELRTTTGRIDWKPYWLGCLAGIVPWLVILLYLVSSQVYGVGVPGFVWGIYASLFVLFNGFAVNMYLQYRRTGKWRRYEFGERLYMVLSLAALDQRSKRDRGGQRGRFEDFAEQSTSLETRRKVSTERNRDRAGDELG